MRQMTFKPDHILAVLFGTSTFDAVYKRKTNNYDYKPFFADLPEAKKDCEDLRDCLEHYNLLKENCYNLDNNPGEYEVV